MYYSGIFTSKIIAGAEGKREWSFNYFMMGVVGLINTTSNFLGIIIRHTVTRKYRVLFLHRHTCTV